MLRFNIFCLRVWNDCLAGGILIKSIGKRLDYLGFNYFMFEIIALIRIYSYLTFPLVFQ